MEIWPNKQLKSFAITHGDTPYENFSDSSWAHILAQDTELIERYQPLTAGRDVALV